MSRPRRRRCIFGRVFDALRNALCRRNRVGVLIQVVPRPPSPSPTDLDPNTTLGDLEKWNAEDLAIYDLESSESEEIKKVCEAMPGEEVKKKSKKKKKKKNEKKKVENEGECSMKSDNNGVSESNDGVGKTQKEKIKRDKKTKVKKWWRRMVEEEEEEAEKKVKVGGERKEVKEE